MKGIQALCCLWNSSANLKLFLNKVLFSFLSRHSNVAKCYQQVNLARRVYRVFFKDLFSFRERGREK